MNDRQGWTADLPQLARWNDPLIRDEGHRNRMSLPELEARMQGWLDGEYQAVSFEVENEPVAYARYRLDDAGIYLRQFFVGVNGGVKAWAGRRIGLNRTRYPELTAVPSTS
jgi:hypothetical protein